MNLSQRQLRVFVTTAMLGNVSRAAEVLHVSQPALTRAIKEFEAALGTPLFRRTTRKLSLSQEGEQFLPVAQRLLLDLDNAATGIRDQAMGLSGTVTLAVGTAFGSMVLPAALKAFTSTHPRVQVRIVDDNSAGITNKVMNIAADIGIGSPVGDTSALECKGLLTAPLGVLANPDVFRLKKRVTEQELGRFPVLREAGDTSVMHLLRMHGSGLVTHAEGGLEVSSLAMQFAMVRAGVGIALLSAIGASHPAALDMQFSTLTPTLSRGLFFMHRRDRPPGPAANALIREIDSAMRKTRFTPGVKFARR